MHLGAPVITITIPRGCANEPQGERSRKMKYAKPEVALVAAFDAIQGTHKPSNVIVEAPGYCAISAYEADE